MEMGGGRGWDGDGGKGWWEGMVDELELVADVVPEVADMFAFVHVGVASSFVFALEPSLVLCLETRSLLGVSVCRRCQCLPIAQGIYLLRLRIRHLPSLRTLARLLTDDTPTGFVF